MEVKIDSKRNNTLLGRTEVYFTVKHVGEGTPNREIIRSELAEKLNIKKENIIVNTIHSSFGNQEVTGYAKAYSSLANLKNLEQDYILKRNKLIEPDKKEKKKVEEIPTKPVEEVKENVEEEKKETAEEASKTVDKPIIDAKEESAEKPKKETDKESKHPNEGKKE